MNGTLADVRIQQSDIDEDEPEETIRYKNGYQPVIDCQTYEIIPGCFQKIQCPAMS